jgi:hypothetical protein
LSTCKEQILFLLGSAYQDSQDNSCTQESLRELKDLISDTKEDVQGQLEEMQQKCSTAATSSQEMLQDDLARLQSSIDSITQAQQVADAVHPKVIIKSNEAGERSRALFGTDTSQPQFTLEVAGNIAGPGAVVGAGVHTPETLQALLQNSQRPETAFLLQALHNQAHGNNMRPFHSIRNNHAAESESHADFSHMSLDTILFPGQRNVRAAGVVELPVHSASSLHEDIHDDEALRSEP